MTNVRPQMSEEPVTIVTSPVTSSTIGEAAENPVGATSLSARAAWNSLSLQKINA